MSEPASKIFDCVQSMREIRDRLSAEIADMSYDELSRWLRSHRYSDPFLQRLDPPGAPPQIRSRRRLGERVRY